MKFVRALLVFVVLLGCLRPVAAQQPAVAHSLFDSGMFGGGTPAPQYDPARLGSLRRQHLKSTELLAKLRTLEAQDREAQLQMFDLINEAAVRRDPSLQHDLDLYGKDLGPIPILAVAHYKWVFGDKSQLDWLLKRAREAGLGRDSFILTVFGYMDEWDQTIRWLKQNEEYDSKHNAAAPGEIVSFAITTRKRLYGAERFAKAWKATKTK